MDTTSLIRPITLQHRRIAAVLAGLDETQLDTATLPSGWTPAGMVLHVGATTRFWCREIMLGEPPTDDVDDLPPFTTPEGVTASEVVSGFLEGTVTDIEAVEGLQLDAAPAWWPEGRWGPWRLADLRAVLLPLLVETATHAGHLDAARELADGATFDYATGMVRTP